MYLVCSCLNHYFFILSRRRRLLTAALIPLPTLRNRNSSIKHIFLLPSSYPLTLVPVFHLCPDSSAFRSLLTCNPCKPSAFSHLPFSCGQGRLSWTKAQLMFLPARHPISSPTVFLHTCPTVSLYHLPPCARALCLSVPTICPPSVLHRHYDSIPL